MKKFREIELNYIKKDSGEVYILVEDILDILRDISRSNIPFTLSTEYIEQIENSVP